jgi:hypothetical protein
MVRTFIALAIAATVTGSGSRAAEGESFKARLSPVPVESTRSGVTGSGSAAATLSEGKLTVQGSFEGMRSAATIAQIHLGQRGVRGPVMFDLAVTKRASGTISGTFRLTPVQIEAVKAGRFYIQIHSESAPDGNLWGWLLSGS